jgi:uncharacterized membrane protein YphA (DoxX/SURF4 family)
MENALWIAQVLLALIFLLTGMTKLTQPRQKMAAGPMLCAADVADAQFRTPGALVTLAHSDQRHEPARVRAALEHVYAADPAVRDESRAAASSVPRL